jgi:hypothetical protein
MICINAVVESTDALMLERDHLLERGRMHETLHIEHHLQFAMMAGEVMVCQPADIEQGDGYGNGYGNGYGYGNGNGDGYGDGYGYGYGYGNGDGDGD